MFLIAKRETDKDKLKNELAYACEHHLAMINDAMWLRNFPPNH